MMGAPKSASGARTLGELSLAAAQRELTAQGVTRSSAPAPSHPQTPLPGLQHVQAALGGPSVPCQLLPPLPLDQLIVQNDGLLLPQQLQGLLVLLSQLLKAGGDSRLFWDPTEQPSLGRQDWGPGPGHRPSPLPNPLCLTCSPQERRFWPPALQNPALLPALALSRAPRMARDVGLRAWEQRTQTALTTRYCCSVWASCCSQASRDTCFCWRAVSRLRRSWGLSWFSPAN